MLMMMNNFNWQLDSLQFWGTLSFSSVLCLHFSLTGETVASFTLSLDFCCLATVSVVRRDRLAAGPSSAAEASMDDSLALADTGAGDAKLRVDVTFSLADDVECFLFSRPKQHIYTCSLLNNSSC